MNTFEVNNSGVFSRCTCCTLLICNLKHLQHCTGSAYPRSCSQHKHLSRQWIASFHWTTCFEKFLCSNNHLIHGIEKTETKQSCDIGLRPPHQSHLSIVKMAIFILTLDLVGLFIYSFFSFWRLSRLSFPNGSRCLLWCEDWGLAVPIIQHPISEDQATRGIFISVLH